MFFFFLFSPTGYYPCSFKNGGCDHTCVVVGSYKERCECTTGYKLLSDGTSCAGKVRHVIFTRQFSDGSNDPRRFYSLGKCLVDHRNILIISILENYSQAFSGKFPYYAKSACATFWKLNLKFVFQIFQQF